MSRDGLVVTVVGWAASTPREVVGDGVPFTSFRVATTPRYFDSRQGVWADGQTEWITVKAFRDAAFNIAASVRKGDPVVVNGRLRTEEWVGENGPRTTLVLEAAAVGHDLTRGTSTFARRINAAPARDDVPVDAGPDPFATQVRESEDAAAGEASGVDEPGGGGAVSGSEGRAPLAGALTS